MIVAQTLAGAAAGLALPSVYSLAAQIAPEGKESRTLGTVLTGWALSPVAGVTISALIADLAGWCAVYVTLIATSLMTTLGLRKLARAEDPKTARAATSPIRALAIPGILPALASGTAALLLTVCPIWGAANHLALNLLIGNLTALDPARRGAVMGLNSFVTYAAMFAGTAAYKPIFETAGFAPLAGLSALSILAALVLALRWTAPQKTA
ncbi:MFS transporter [Aestuariibius insulae]|uniref:MFS transporter n=1 Tax=Aestuariibius insulae TaxID=2058287 RepID=UPI00345E177B